MIWFYMIWCDVMWYNLIRYDMIWYDMIWHDMIIWYEMIWYDVIFINKYNSIQIILSVIHLSPLWYKILLKFIFKLFHITPKIFLFSLPFKKLQQFSKPCKKSQKLFKIILKILIVYHFKCFSFFCSTVSIKKMCNLKVRSHFHVLLSLGNKK